MDRKIRWTDNKKVRFEMAIDITDRKKAEIEIKRNQEIFRIAFDSANIGIMNVDKTGKILYANHECTNIFGYESNELENMNVNDITVHEDKNVSPRFIKTALKDSTHKKSVFTKRYFHKNGTIITCEISSTLLHDANGEPLYFISHIKDITKQKQAEKQIVKQNEALKKHEQELEIALENKDILLKEVHHRVKNNLQTISSLLNQQQILSKDPKVANALRDSMNRVATMALIHQFIYKSADLKNINMNNYINDLVSKLANTYRQSNQVVQLDIKIDEIFFDIEKTIPIALIINEILTNIFKYAFAKTKKGKINIFLLKTETDKYRLEISDNGSGFPENFIPEKSKSLGMYLIKNLSKRQLQGKLKITSAPNKGVKYEIEF